MADDENPLSDDREVDEEASDNPPGKGEHDASFWKVQIEQSKTAAEPQLNATDEAVREYLGSYAPLQAANKKDRWNEVRFPIFWSSIRTMQPALYSQTPTPVGERMLDDEDDPIARLASIMIERLAKYLIRATPFDRVEMMTCTTFLWSGKVTNKVCFYDESYDLAEGKEKSVKVYYALSTDDQGNQDLVSDEGQPLPDGVEVFEDDKGYYTEEPAEEFGRKYIALEPVAYNDILHSPQARHWDEVDWLAFRLLLNKADVKERFGTEVAEDLTYSASLNEVKEKDKKSETRAESYAEVWEIWDRQTKTVRYVCDSYEDFLEAPKDDPYGLPGFYPCPPFMLGTVGPDDLYPVPDYIQLRPLILQLHAFAKRLKRLIKATQALGIFDNTVTELTNLATEALDGDFIGVQNFAQIMNKGGLAQIVQFFPTDVFATTVQLMFQSMQQYEQMFNDIYGIPDIIRGTSDPNETAAAQQMKGRYASLRFSFMQREFQRLVRDDIEIMCDIALASFDDHQLMEIMGYRFMDPNDQPNFDLALTLLRDPVERIVRVSIQTDSTITMNEEADKAQRKELADTIFSGIQSFAPLIQQSPALGAALSSVVMMLVRGERDGKDTEEKLQKAFDQMLQPPPPPPPPGPDPTAMAQIASNEKIEQAKLNADMKKEQMKIMVDNSENHQDFALGQMKEQTGQMKAETDAKFKMMDLQLQQAGMAQQNQESAANIKKELLEMQFNFKELQQDFALRKAELQADIRKANQEGQLDKIKVALDAHAQVNSQKLDAFNAKLSGFTAHQNAVHQSLDTLRSASEERRADSQHLMEKHDQLHQHVMGIADQVRANSETMPLMQEPSQPKRKSYEMQRDKNGDLTRVIESEV